MTRWLGIFFVIVAAGLLFSAVEAQDTPKKKLDAEAIFKKLDTNNDGKLSKEEFLKLAERFKDKEKAREKLTLAYIKIDTSKMGLSVEQFRNFIDSVRKKDEKPQ